MERALLGLALNIGRLPWAACFPKAYGAEKQIPVRAVAMCAYCYTVLGTFVGGAALAKVGGFAAIKSAATTFVAALVLLRR